MRVDVNALYYLGESYRLEKNNIKAALAYEALIQHYPNDPLATNAKAQLSEVTKEKQDPLATLLKRDGRPALASSQPSRFDRPERLTAEGTVSAQQKQPRDVNLVAKKEVAHEEPGEEKGMLRRVGSALNPLGWFSADDKKENRKEPIETAKKKESSGSFWSSLNPFAGNADAKVEARPDPQLVSNVDEALKQKGIDSGIEKVLPKAPASDLPKVEEAAPPPSDTAELLGSVDTALQKEGKRLSELPPPPEPAPIFKASSAAPGKPATPTTVTTSSPATQGLIGGVDEALRRKGIDPSKIETVEKSGAPGAGKTGSSSQAPAVSSRPKVELSPKLPQEKGPLFLDGGEYQAREKINESGKAKTAGGSEASQPSNIPASRSASQLPQAVVKGPQTAKEKPAETKVTEKKAPDDEEEKGALDQLREDVGRVRDFLNPFNW